MLGAENIILGKVDLVPTLKKLTFWRKERQYQSSKPTITKHDSYVRLKKGSGRGEGSGWAGASQGALEYDF